MWFWWITVLSVSDIPWKCPNLNHILFVLIVNKILFDENNKRIMFFTVAGGFSSLQSNHQMNKCKQQTEIARVTRCSFIYVSELTCVFTTKSKKTHVCWRRIKTTELFYSFSQLSWHTAKTSPPSTTTTIYIHLHRSAAVWEDAHLSALTFLTAAWTFKTRDEGNM